MAERYLRCLDKIMGHLMLLISPSTAVWWSGQQHHGKGENPLSCFLGQVPEAAAFVAASVWMTAGKVFLSYTDGGWEGCWWCFICLGLVITVYCFYRNSPVGTDQAIGKYCVRKAMYKTWKVHFPWCCSTPT